MSALPQKVHSERGISKSLPAKKQKGQPGGRPSLISMNLLNRFADDDY